MSRGCECSGLRRPIGASISRGRRRSRPAVAKRGRGHSVSPGSDRRPSHRACCRHGGEKGGSKGRSGYLGPPSASPPPQPQPASDQLPLPPHRSVDPSRLLHLTICVLSCGTSSTSQQRAKSMRSIRLENGSDREFVMSLRPCDSKGCSPVGIGAAEIDSSPAVASWRRPSFRWSVALRFIGGGGF